MVQSALIWFHFKMTAPELMKNTNSPSMASTAAPTAAKKMLSTEIWLGVTEERASAALSDDAQPLPRAAIGLRFSCCPMALMVIDCGNGGGRLHAALPISLRRSR